MPEHHIAWLYLRYAHHRLLELQVRMRQGIGRGPDEDVAVGVYSREICIRDIYRMQESQSRMPSDFVEVRVNDKPYVQWAGLYTSAAASGVGLKNGRKMMYALESSTSGKTCSVPCPGAVRLRASQPWYARNTLACQNARSQLCPILPQENRG